MDVTRIVAMNETTYNIVVGFREDGLYGGRTIFHADQWLWISSISTLDPIFPGYKSHRFVYCEIGMWVSG